jgi:hypothetical protein
MYSLLVLLFEVQNVHYILYGTICVVNILNLVCCIV